MSASSIKGSLLEYIMRLLLQNSGFTQIVPDGHYVYKKGNLFFINGKGAAHDADVAMDPPFQIPFTTPARIVFECKAYKRTTGLDVIRNALGLKYDLNEFEIVTNKTVETRKRNKKSTYSISSRKRFQYNVGVATISEFSRAAFEFAANNKIPLFSLRWFLPAELCALFQRIDDNYLQGTPTLLDKYLKEKDQSIQNAQLYDAVRDFLASDQIVGRIIAETQSRIEDSIIGLLESGDLIFLFKNRHDFTLGKRQFMTSEIYWCRNQPKEWYIKLDESNVCYTQSGNQQEGQGNRDFANCHYKFFLPKSVFESWFSNDLSEIEALRIKETLFSKVYLFHRSTEQDRLPISILKLNIQWFQNISG